MPLKRPQVTLVIWSQCPAEPHLLSLLFPILSQEASLFFNLSYFLTHTNFVLPRFHPRICPGASLSDPNGPKFFLRNSNLEVNNDSDWAWREEGKFDHLFFKKENN